ncbi:unnamed protein product [Ilex paraguariensis]|uniref:Transmembrane protein 18 n=1 Tax=Ilex paraguariensis TaxID=185542 RepID=A0ABC8SE74_9AQUA
MAWEYGNVVLALHMHTPVDMQYSQTFYVALHENVLILTGVYLAERLNGFLGDNWKSFAGQNYFDPHGLFLSVLWSGPLLVMAIIILVNTLFALCQLIVRWKRAELRQRAREARNKQE